MAEHFTGLNPDIVEPESSICSSEGDCIGVLVGTWYKLSAECKKYAMQKKNRLLLLLLSPPIANSSLLRMLLPPSVSGNINKIAEEVCLWVEGGFGGYEK